MENKKGFTLTELLVVIVIIGVISVIAIPSVMLVNKNINKRLLNQKKETIVSAAELYATDNPDIFNGTNEVKVYVAELINYDYLKIEEKDKNLSNCLNATTDKGEISTDGCIINPVDSTSMNTEYVILRKETAGIIGEYGGDMLSSDNGNTLVDAICLRINSGVFVAKADETTECACDREISPTKLVKKGTNEEVNACLITGQTSENYLLYDNVYFRVIGLYKVDNKIVPKMITDNNIDVN